MILEQTRRIQDFISKNRGAAEKTSREHQGYRRRSSPRLDRQTRQTHFEFDDGDDNELAKNINDILSYMEESSKELNELKMDVQRLISHFSSVSSDQGSTHM